MVEYDTVAIVGVGLLGGSIGLALRERRLAQKIIGIGRRQNSLDAARKVGAIDNGVTNLANGVAQAQLIIIATPVDTIAERGIQAAAVCPATSLITDVGSRKEAIVTAGDLGPRRRGGAGRGLAGVIHLRAIIARDPTMRGPICSRGGRWS